MGLTWSPVNNGLPASYTNSLKFISSTLYAVASSNLYKSTDGGLNWASVTINGNSYLQGIVSDPSSVQTMYVYSYYGVFKTVDGGVAWNSLQDGQGLSNINNLAVSPLDNKLYVATTRYTCNTNCIAYTDIYILSTATAPPPPTYNLNILRNGSGSGTVQYSGYAITGYNYYSITMIPVTNCSGTGTCGGSYPEMAQITVTATPAPGSVFAGWTGCDQVGGNNCKVNLFAPQSVTATFDLDQKPLAVLASPPRWVLIDTTGSNYCCQQGGHDLLYPRWFDAECLSSKYSAPITISQGRSTTLKMSP